MSRLEYEYDSRRPDRTVPIKVRLDGKLAGEIRHVLEGTPGVNMREGWRYFPKGSRSGGELYSSPLECKQSLEQE